MLLSDFHGKAEVCVQFFHGKPEYNQFGGNYSFPTFRFRLVYFNTPDWYGSNKNMDSELFDLKFQADEEHGRGDWYGGTIEHLSLSNNSYMKNSIKVLSAFAKFKEDEGIGFGGWGTRRQMVKFLKKHKITTVVYDRETNCFIPRKYKNDPELYWRMKAKKLVK